MLVNLNKMLSLVGLHTTVILQQSIFDCLLEEHRQRQH